MFAVQNIFFSKKMRKHLHSIKICRTFAPAFEKEQPIGAVVQLVRIPACHAVGREFESRPHRKKIRELRFVTLLFFCGFITSLFYFTTLPRAS